MALNGDDVFETQAKTNLNIVDLTGAGDLFAAGFLHGYTNNKNPHESLKLGTEMASKIIQKIGARLD
jgi:fructokinase